MISHWGSLVFTGGGGGGPSHIFPAPWYQSGVNTDNGMRTVPDISMDGDPNTGMLEGQTQTFPDGSCPGGGTVCYGEYRIGGTSVSSPLFAGVMALVNQERSNNNLPPLGFANPAIYHRYGTGAFRDVTDFPLGPRRLAQVRANYTNPATKGLPLLYYLRTLGIDGEGAAALRATRGYDDATGVGSPRAYIQSFRRA